MVALQFVGTLVFLFGAHPSFAIRELAKLPTQLQGDVLLQTCLDVNSAAVPVMVRVLQGLKDELGQNLVPANMRIALAENIFRARTCRFKGWGDVLATAQAAKLHFRNSVYNQYMQRIEADLSSLKENTRLCFGPDCRASGKFDATWATQKDLVEHGVRFATATAIVQVRTVKCLFKNYDDFSQRVEAFQTLNIAAKTKLFGVGVLCLINGESPPDWNNFMLVPSAKPPKSPKGQSVDLSSGTNIVFAAAGFSTLPKKESNQDTVDATLCNLADVLVSIPVVTVEAIGATMQSLETDGVNIAAVTAMPISCQIQELLHILYIPASEKRDLTCEAGHVPERFTVTCTEDGELEGLVPCAPVDCGDPLPLFGGADKAVYFGASTLYGHEVEVRCSDSSAILPITIRCLATGSWSKQGPECEAPKVPEAPTVEELPPVLRNCPAGHSNNGKPCGSELCHALAHQSCLPVQCTLPELDLESLKGLRVLPGLVSQQLFQFGQSLIISVVDQHDHFYTFDPLGRVSVENSKSKTFTCNHEGKLLGPSNEEFASRAISKYEVNCGLVSKASWWSSAFYDKLFLIVPPESDGSVTKLRCRIESTRNMNCLASAIVNAAFKQRQDLKKGESIDLRCGPNGEWVPPSSLETQTCAYPLSSKIFGNTYSLAPTKRDRRVLSLKRSGSQSPLIGQLETTPFLKKESSQLWTLDDSGQIRSAFDPDHCLSGINPATGKSTGYWESYLFVRPCSHNDKWTLEPHGNMGQHCSLKYEHFGNSLLFGTFALTFPPPASKIVPGSTAWPSYYNYTWMGDGTIERQRPSFHADGPDMESTVGYRVDEGGNVLVPRDSRGLRLSSAFILQAEWFPKVLSSRTAGFSAPDEELSMVDFWLDYASE